MDAMFYRIEINFIYLAVLCTIEFFGVRKDYGTNRIALEEIVFRCMTILNIAICVFEMIGLCLEGNMHLGVYAILQICHGSFYLFSTAIAYLWFVYVLIQFQKENLKRCFFYAIPLFFFTGLVFTNSIHEHLFLITEDHTYGRGTWVELHWIICGFYMLMATGMTVLKLIEAKSYRKRKLIYPLLYFVIPPITTAFLQVLLEGSSMLQGGFTLSLLLIAVSEKEKSIYADALTGLGNRRGLYRYIDRYAQAALQKVHCMVIDVDQFKEINDNFGHDMGDQALVDTAQVLTKVCSEWSGDYYICRYGGDEFVIAWRNCTQDQISAVKERIFTYLDEVNHTKKQRYRLKVSIGIAGMVCTSIKDIERVIGDADRDMYAQKREKHRRNE